MRSPIIKTLSQLQTPKSSFDGALVVNSPPPLPQLVEVELEVTEQTTEGSKLVAQLAVPTEAAGIADISNADFILSCELFGHDEHCLKIGIELMGNREFDGVVVETHLACFMGQPMKLGSWNVGPDRSFAAFITCKSVAMKNVQKEREEAKLRAKVEKALEKRITIQKETTNSLP